MKWLADFREGIREFRGLLEDLGGDYILGVVGLVCLYKIAVAIAPIVKEGVIEWQKNKHAQHRALRRIEETLERRRAKDAAKAKVDNESGLPAAGRAASKKRRG